MLIVCSLQHIFNVKSIDRYITKDSNISLKLVLTVKSFSLNKF